MRAAFLRSPASLSSALLTALAQPALLHAQTTPLPAPSTPTAQAEPQAQAAQAPSIDAQLEAIRATHNLPALAAAAVVGDRTVALAAVGLRAIGSEQPVTLDDRWHIGSDTKAMTAVLCARLIERGLLRWDTTLADAFPDLAPEMHEAWRSVTLEHLLTNRSGAPTDLRAGGLWARLWRMNEQGDTPRAQRRALLQGVTAQPPVHEPGTRMLYSNAGFAIAGHIAETIVGDAYETLMAREVFAPLGITTAGFGAPGSIDAIDQPRGHRGRTPPFEPVPPGPAADNPPAIAPAGGVHLSLADCARFLAAVAQGESGAGAAAGFLKPDTWRRLHTPIGERAPIQGYAMGWAASQRPWAKGPAQIDQGRVLTHAGSNTMWYAVAWVAPERGLSLLAVTNAAGEAGPRAADEAIGVMLRAVDADAAQPQPQPQPQPQSQPQTQTQTR